jgi:predicted dehydrogenase
MISAATGDILRPQGKAENYRLSGMMSREQSEPVSVLMVAIGGYGFHYLKALLEEQEPAHCRLAGVVDPMAEGSLLWPVVSHLGIPICSSMEEFYGAGHHADLAVISSPIHWHVPQSLAALSNGSSVLCDKPVGATIQEVDELIRARDRSGHWVMIGYQWSYSAAILALKRDILAGHFGRPLKLSALCCWPRDASYYHRNDWAGRLRDPHTGRWVLDSPANNAMAHYLHNLFYIVGPELHLSARPHLLQAELYRAYPVETFDTAMCRVIAENGTEMLFLASHATEGTFDPRFRLEFEDAIVTYGENGGGIVAVGRKGERKCYGAPDDTPQFHKLFAAIDYVKGIGSLVCGPEAALSQTLCINGLHESVTEIPSFPAALIRRAGTPERIYVSGLDDVLLRCYREGKLPGEAGIPWAAAGRPISLADYSHFPGGKL